MQTTTPRKRKTGNLHSKQNLKKLRAAEARYQYELLEEARTLKDHLADFWDLRLDKRYRLDSHEFGGGTDSAGSVTHFIQGN
jgi:hypothetical protein